jgi:RHS repeat-associated protein
MDHTMVKMGTSYLAQYTRMAELQKRIGNSQHVMHHMVGLVYTETDPSNGWALNPNPPSTDNEWFIRDRGIRINIDGAISVNSNTNVAADRRKVIHSTLTTAAALEGSIFEQMLDTTSTGSTATRFRWGNQNIADLKYYLFRPTSPPPGGWFGADFTSLGCVPDAQTPPVIPDYVNSTAGFWAIAAAENCLGPGEKQGPPDGAGAEWPSMKRGPAFVAFTPDHDSVAHVVAYNGNAGFAGQWFKGGGAGAPAEYAREFDAAGAASLLKDNFEDRSRLHGIDLHSGELTYSAPADIRLGEGGFPYELSFQRTFKPGAGASVGLPDGWAHNLDVRAAYSGDGLAKMGMDSAAAAAETIATIATLQQIYASAPPLDDETTNGQMRDHLKRWVLGPFVADWWNSKLNYNVVTINAGHEARQFTRHADGNFYPPRNGVGTLVQTGERFAGIGGSPYHSYWKYNDVTFTYTSPEKDVQQFAYYEYDNYQGVHGLPTENYGRKSHGWHLSSWTFPYGVTLSYSYSQSGGGSTSSDLLSSVSNNLGRTLTLNYGPSPDTDAPLLTSVTDGQGRTVTIAQPAASYKDRILTQVTLPEAGNGAEIARYQYVGDGENSAAALPDARPQRYPKLYKVFAPSDEDDPKVQIDYDRTWRVKEYRDAVAIRTPGQRQPWKFFITGSSRGERADPEGGEYTAYYDSRGRAFSLVDEENRAVTQTFDNHDRVKERTFPEGNKVQFGYDDRTHNVSSLKQLRKAPEFWNGTQTLPPVSATYHATCGRIETVTDAIGNVTTWNYNGTTCNLTSIVQPPVANPEAGGAMTSPTTSFLYNGFGQVTQITDPTNRVVNIEYDATTRYRLRRRVNQAGLDLTTTYGHNAFGDIDSVDGPRTDVTDVTTYTFDKMRRLKQIDAPLCAKTKNIMDLDGDVYRVERAENCTPTWQVWQKTFTPTKKVNTETSPTNAVTDYDYDGVDRVSIVTDPDGRKVFTDYFMDGKTKQIIKAYQSVTMPPIEYVTYTYTPNGQIDTVKDANGNFTNLDYDGFDRLHRTFHADPANGTPCAPAIPHFAGVPSVCTAQQRYEQLNYDVNGNVTSKRNRSGNSITFEFDALNRETTRNVPANTLAHFARTLTTNYDLASRKYDVTVVEAPLANQTLSHRYDAAGRVDYVDDSLLGATNRLDYGYDPADNRTTVAYPGGTTVTYTFDALNRMDTVTYGALQLANYDWDTLSRRDMVQLNAGTLSMDLEYEDDDDLESLAHTGPRPLTFDFERNDSGQILNLIASDGTFLSRPVSTVGVGYVPDRLNRYTSVGGTAFTWDTNGNLTGDGTYTYEYDEENRLRTAVGGGVSSSYEYDPLGRRRAKAVNGTLIRFVSDNAEEIEERDASQAVLRRYMYGSGIDERIAMIEVATPTNCPGGGGRCYYLTNWQGSTTTLVNQDGSLNATYHYGPYGEQTNWNPADAATGNPFRYTGRRFDPETGLYYYRARYYSPKLGRFLQTDPVGNDDDINLYLYSGNDPTNFVDHTGAGKKWVATLVKLSGKGMKEVAKLSKTGAVQLRRQGESILAQSRQKAREIEVAAHGEGKLIRHKAHDADFRPHYQTEDKPGHSFWTAVLGSALLAAADAGDSVAEAAEAAGTEMENNAPLIGDIAALADPIALMKSGDMPPPPGFVEGPFGTWTKVDAQDSGDDSGNDTKTCTGTRTTRDESEPCPW